MVATMIFGQMVKMRKRSLDTKKWTNVSQKV